MHGQSSAHRPEELASQHLDIVAPLVRQITARFPRHVDRDDLVGDGVAGLVDAATRYDADDGVPFVQYARIRVRGAVIDGARARDWAPRSLRRRLRALAAAGDALRGREQRDPTTAELAAELRWLPHDVEAVLAEEQAATLLAIERPATADRDVPILEELAEEDPMVLPAEAIERREATETLRRGVAALPDPLHWVVVEHDLRGRRLAELAHELGVSDARLSQLHREAIEALRAAFCQVYDEVPPVDVDAPGRSRRQHVIESMRASGRPPGRDPDGCAGVGTHA